MWRQYKHRQLWVMANTWQVANFLPQVLGICSYPLQLLGINGLMLKPHLQWSGGWRCSSSKPTGIFERQGPVWLAAANSAAWQVHGFGKRVGNDVFHMGQPGQQAADSFAMLAQ